MKRFLFGMTLILTVVLTACGGEENHSNHSMSDDVVPEVLEVELTVPKTAATGEKVEFIAKVTQGEKAVEDANEVKFEVLNKATGGKELVTGTLNKDKHYVASYHFKEAGVYDITSHVTARNMHTMPSKTIEVSGEELTSTTTETNSTSQTTSHSEGAGHHSNEATIEFEDGTATVGVAIELTANILLSDSPLEGARVQYEIFRHDVDYHHWLEASETDTGKYEVEFTFTESGTYEVQVHVTKGDDIHDHVKKTYIVE